MIYNEDYQYDSCVSRGICSVNPRTSSLQEVLVLYLKTTAYYALKLYDFGKINTDAKHVILNTISIMVSNPEFSESDFELLTARFNEVLPDIIEEYQEICKEKGVEPDLIKTPLKSYKKMDIIQAIQFGEKEFLKGAKALSQEVRDLYKVLFVIAKSICINILDLETYEAEEPEGYLTILQILDSLNSVEQDVEKIKSLILDVSKIDNKLMKLLRRTQEERYGKQRVFEVSFTTTPGKAVLVVGSNIRELEDILDALMQMDIYVYTHDEMMLANTFPKFAEYKNLKGQFGQGMESCLLDFATFPGPIILTKHSLFNVEHLYRGRLYTTDTAYSKGVIPIKNKDFSDVIKAANETKGFKTGKQCESVNIGFNYDEFLEILKEKLAAKKYTHIFIIGQGGYTLDQQTYFNKLLRQTPDDVLIISLSYPHSRDNIIHLNGCYDSFAVTKIAEGVGVNEGVNEGVNKGGNGEENRAIPITVFFPQCSRHTMSQMMFLSSIDNLGIYVGKCTPIILNPNLINTLNKVFNIHGLSSVKKDLDEILNKK